MKIICDTEIVCAKQLANANLYKGVQERFISHIRNLVLPPEAGGIFVIMYLSLHFTSELGSVSF